MAGTTQTSKVGSLQVDGVAPDESPAHPLALAGSRTYVRAMSRGRRQFDHEKHEQAKRSQPRPGLDTLVEVVRREAGDEIAEDYRRLNQPPASAEPTEPLGH
jgi:hypothetical protein